MVRRDDKAARNAGQTYHPLRYASQSGMTSMTVLLGQLDSCISCDYHSTILVDPLWRRKNGTTPSAGSGQGNTGKKRPLG